MPQKERHKVQNALLKESLNKKLESKVMHSQYIRSMLDSLLVRMTRTVEGRSESRD